MTRRLRKRPSPRLVAAAVLLVVLLARFAWLQLQYPPPPLVPLVEGPCTVLEVVDGDTLIVSQGSGSARQGVRVRLLQVACPPAIEHSGSEAWAAQAADFTRAFLARGNTHLRLDRRRQDPDDCFLAYVFVDARMLNLELIHAGLARVRARPGDSSSIARQLRLAELEARTAQRGMWRAAD